MIQEMKKDIAAGAFSCEQQAGGRNESAYRLQVGLLSFSTMCFDALFTGLADQYLGVSRRLLKEPAWVSVQTRVRVFHHHSHLRLLRGDNLTIIDNPHHLSLPAGFETSDATWVDSEVCFLEEQRWCGHRFRFSGVRASLALDPSSTTTTYLNLG